MPLILADPSSLESQLKKAFDLHGGPDTFIKNFNANPDNHKQYHDAIRILKALVNERPNSLDPEMIPFLNRLRLPPSPLSYLEMAPSLKGSFRAEFVQAGLKREAILSKMTLPELEELRGDFNEALQNAKDDKFKQIYQQLIVQINKTIDERKAPEKQASPEPKKSSPFNLFSKHGKEHGESFGQRMKDTMSKIIPGRRNK